MRDLRFARLEEGVEGGGLELEGATRIPCGQWASTPRGYRRRRALTDLVTRWALVALSSVAESSSLRRAAVPDPGEELSPLHVRRSSHRQPAVLPPHRHGYGTRLELRGRRVSVDCSKPVPGAALRQTIAHVQGFSEAVSQPVIPFTLCTTIIHPIPLTTS